MPRKRLLIALFVAIAVKSSAYGVMFTMLDDYREQFGISEGALGLVIAIGFFTSFFAQITIAPLADRGRSRQLIFIGLTLAIIGNFAMALSDSLPELLGSRFISGVGLGCALPAMRRVIIVSEPENLGRNLGRVLSCEVGGFAAGPVISAFLVAPFGIPAPFLVIGIALSIVTTTIFAMPIPETAAEDHPTERFAIDLLRNRSIAAGVLIGVAVFFMIGTFDSLWALMMNDLDAPTWMANTGVTLFVLPMVVMAPYGGRFVQRVGPFRAGGFGMLFGAACMALYGAISVPWLLMVVFLVHTLNDGMTVTSAGVSVGMVAPPERQAGAQGVLGGIQTLTGGIAASFAGVSYEYFGRTTTFAIAGLVMAALVGMARLLAGDRWGLRGGTPAVPAHV
ncbi:MAG: MFS transporter [Acidimicrobiaceae bacterium]|nr:MFS transporter [Ilumatobacteraceae bacterium]NQW68079.1 MFS transporter [Acidimicrobiaceae bacterium]